MPWGDRGTAQAGREVGTARARPNLLLGRGASLKRKVATLAGNWFLLAVTSASAVAVLLIFVFVIKDALPFFRLRGLGEFLTSTRWFPSREPPEFGALAIFYGSALVTVGAAVFAVPMGVAAAVCLSDVLPFWLRQAVKPVIEILAAIPSVAYGFFALVVLAPQLQSNGGRMLFWTTWIMGLPLGGLIALVLADLAANKLPEASRRTGRLVFGGLLGAAVLAGLALLSARMGRIVIPSGTNALNVSLILGIMSLPTVVSVSEDALQAVGRELREASYALGATRAETMVRVVIPAASSGILAAVILGVMRAVGETMVVWMASGNTAQIPSPPYNLLLPVRTLTATIAGDMGEADQLSGAERYSVLFAMAAALLAISFVCNLASEWAMRRARRKLAGG